MLNHGYDPIPRVSFRADDTPTGAFLQSPLFLRQRYADSFRARFEATRRGKMLRHLGNGGVGDEKPVVIHNSITDYRERP